MKILSSKYDGKCKACDTFINAGDSVRWSKADGVSWTTCMACPHEPKAKTPANGTPVNDAALQAALLAALSDGQALRARIGEQEAEIARLRAVLVEARSAITQTVNERDEARQVAAARRMGPGAAVIAHVLRPDPAYPAPTATPDDDCPI
jgi:hypothetical protein